MTDDLKRSMFDYYSQRAPEFDDIYRGAGPASVPDPGAYRSEVKVLAGIVEQTCHGDLIDLGCGTAFWLPYYAGRCSRITLFDQSEAMLAAARRRAAEARVADRTATVAGDVLAHDFGPARFDSVLVGFLLSHLTDEEEARFFRLLTSLVKPCGAILILDSTWSEARARTRRKAGPQTRTLEDGREFLIYKKHFDQNDLVAMATTHGVKVAVEHFGKVFLAARVSVER